MMWKWWILPVVVTVSALFTLVYIGKESASFQQLATLRRHHNCTTAVRNNITKGSIGSIVSDSICRTVVNDSSSVVKPTLENSTTHSHSGVDHDPERGGVSLDLAQNSGISISREGIGKVNHQHSNSEEDAQFNNNNNNNNHDQTTGGTIYVCGWRYDGLIRRLFPEFRHTVDLQLDTPSSADSLLILGIYGPCIHKPKRRSYTLSWLANTWKGNVLLVNSENTARMKPLDIPDRLFRIGMYPESNHSVYVFYVAMALIGEFNETQWDQVFLPTRKPQSTREYFCIYAVTNCVDFREVAVDDISTFIQSVDQWGPCGGKNGTLLHTVVDTPQYHEWYPPTAAAASLSWHDNAALFRHYRFCLVMENSVAPGYISEKILVAFLGGCIPIYYGTVEILDIFNPNAFVFYNISNPQPALDRIRFLEENITAYMHVSRDEPILAHGNLTIDKYFSLDDTVGNGTLKHKIRAMLGLETK